MHKLRLLVRVLRPHSDGVRGQWRVLLVASILLVRGACATTAVVWRPSAVRGGGTVDASSWAEVMHVRLQLLLLLVVAPMRAHPATTTNAAGASYAAVGVHASSASASAGNGCRRHRSGGGGRRRAASMAAASSSSSSVIASVSLTHCGVRAACGGRPASTAVLAVMVQVVVQRAELLLVVVHHHHVSVVRGAVAGRLREEGATATATAAGIG